MTTNLKADSARQTPKQVLWQHLEDMHRPGQPSRKRSNRWTLSELQHWHANEHFRHSPNHFHAGRNTGPDDRPPGWKTGRDAVRKDARKG